MANSFLSNSTEKWEEQGIFFELYISYSHQVRKYLQRYLPNCPEDVEDCFQQCCINMLWNIRKISGLNPIHRRNYFFTTARSVAVNLLRQKGKCTLISLDEIHTERGSLGSPMYVLPNPEDIIIAKEDWEILQNQFSSLSPTERIILYRYFLGGIDRQALAAEIGVSIDTVRSYISRTRQHIQKLSKDLLRKVKPQNEEKGNFFCRVKRV